jgi:hypothetical protein
MSNKNYMNDHILIQSVQNVSKSGARNGPFCRDGMRGREMELEAESDCKRARQKAPELENATSCRPSPSASEETASFPRWRSGSDPRGAPTDFGTFVERGRVSAPWFLHGALTRPRSK